MILAADVGGTKTHLALFEPDAPVRSPVLDRKVASRGAPSLEAIVRGFTDEAGTRVTRAVLGIAGPVVDNRSDTTNLPWNVDGARLGDALGAPVRLLNDLEATAWGLDQLEGADLATLQPGRPAYGNRALIAAGTGLGESILPFLGDRWHASPSEGGHTDFGPRDAVEDALLVWLRARYGRVSYERILSGPGLADLFRFHRDAGLGDEPRAFAAAFDAADDPAAEVTRGALDGSCERARRTLERFVAVFGAEAGNLALKALAVGGVFVGGGIAPRILPVLEAGGFVRAFRDKGRLTPVVEAIPIHVVLDDRTALWGAAAVALERIPPPPSATRGDLR